MSSYHQTASQPSKSDRRFEHHRERQATRSALQSTGLEDLLDPPRVHNVATSHSEARPEAKDPQWHHGDHRHWARHAKSFPGRHQAIAALVIQRN